MTTQPPMHIDAEVHFWKYEKTNANIVIRNNKFLKQDHLPEQLTQSLLRNGMNGCIAAVAEDSELETRFLSELALTHSEILGVVGWTDLSNPRAGEKIQELHQYTPLKGFQTGTAKRPEPAGEVMDLLNTFQYSLDLSLEPDTDTIALGKWIASHPNQQFILRNAGNPYATHALKTDWENQIRTLAKNENLSCKVAGFLTNVRANSWKPGDFYPYLDILFDAFGSSRLLYASDWPFLLLGGIYVQWKSLLEKFTEKFIAEDRDLFFGNNAQRIYRL